MVLLQTTFDLKYIYILVDLFIFIFIFISFCPVSIIFAKFSIPLNPILIWSNTMLGYKPQRPSNCILFAEIHLFKRSNLYH